MPASSALALAAAALCGVLLVGGQRLGGFAAALVAGGALALTGWKAGDTVNPRSRFADALAERGVDAMILGTLAWWALPEERGVAAAALAALIASYLASYVRARAVGLGFHLEEALLLRSARLALVALAVLGSPTLIPLLAATGVSVQTIVLRAVAVARQKEQR